MKFSILAVLVSATSVYAGLCNAPGSLGSATVGTTANIVQVSATSPSGNFTTTVSGRVKVTGGCALTFEDFTLTNAPANAQM